MKRLPLVLLAAGLCLLGQKKRPPAPPGKPPDLQVIEMRVHREENVIAFDGLLRNNSTRVFKGITIFFEFLDADKRLVSRRSIAVTSSNVAPNEEAEVQAQTPDQARVVYYLLDAEDKDGRYLTLDKPGPHLIE